MSVELFFRQAKLDNRQDEFETQKAKMKQLEDSWRPSLDQLITKIDSNFSTFMSSLGCAGEVRRLCLIYKPWATESNCKQLKAGFTARLIRRFQNQVDLRIPEVNSDDYAAYGIRIKVKFRSSETLRELTAHHQSGGERAVSTVLYMMALQVSATQCQS